MRKIDGRTGIITTVAGTGKPGYAGDAGPATSARLNQPNGIARDASGNLFIADRLNHAIRRVDAGTGTAGSGGDGGPATSAQLNVPHGIAVAESGGLVIADQGNERIRMVAAGSGMITTVAGVGTQGCCEDGGPAPSGLLKGPVRVAVGADGDLFIADAGNHRIRLVGAGSASSTFTLSVSVTGPGTVTSTPAGITCPGTCNATFPEGTLMILTASWGTGANFTGYGNSDGNACLLVMAQDRFVTAAFRPQVAVLSVTVTGEGEVTSQPAGLRCAATTTAACTASFSLDTPVTLTATSEEPWRFSAFQGCDGQGGNTCSVRMGGERSVTATFVQASPVLTATVRGEGTVTSEPPGLRCTAAGGTCRATFSPGTTVLLRATPGPGGCFEGWGSTCDLQFEDTCRVDLTQDRSVTAAFGSQGPTLSLTVTAGGTVTSEPGGLDCGGGGGATCTATFPLGATVTLSATPAPEHLLAWTGCYEAFQNACTLKMDAARAVTATFSTAATNRPVITAPADNARQRRGTKITLAWVPVLEDVGIALYALEYTGVGRTFANPRGTGPDPVNGFGGAGGGLVLGGPMTSAATFLVSEALALGTYQYRIFPVDELGVVPLGLTASDAQTLEIISDGR